MVMVCKSSFFQYSRFAMLFTLEFFNGEYVWVSEVLELG